MNVLFVEPDQVLAEALQRQLEATGHHVMWRKSAQTALDALDELIPDVIVLEIQLGLHNGIEFLYEIRSYPEWQTIPVIVHTMNLRAQQKQFAEAFAQLGVKTILYKPRTSTKQLLSAVNDVYITA